MPKLVVDPGVLSLLYPNASSSRPRKIRMVAQVTGYTPPMLHVTRLANLAEIHSHIDVDTGEHNEAEAPPVDLSMVTENINNETVQKGAVVSIWGVYDGSTVRAVEIYATTGQEVLDGGANVLAEFSVLNDL